MRFGAVRLPAALLAAVCIFAPLRLARSATPASEPASASKASATLVLEKGPGTDACIGSPLLRTSVEKRLRRRAFVSLDRSTPTLQLHVRFLKQAAEFQARIEVSSGDGTPRGQRLLVTSAAHCSALDDSLALSLALLVDAPPEPLAPAAPEALAPAGAPQTVATLPAASATRPAGASPLAIPEHTAAPREPWHFALGLGARAAWGALPGVAPAFSLGARVIPRSFPAILLEGDLWLPREAPRDADSGARFRMARAGVFLCPAFSSGPHQSWGFCLGQEVGWLSVDGYGFDRNLQDGGLTYALAARGEVSVSLVAPLSLRGFLGAEVPLVRDRFVGVGPGARELFRPQPLAVLAGIGAEVALW